MKRIISVLMALAVVISAAVLFSSCGNEDGAPNGMKIASAAKAPYRFYVPDSWQCDVASGATTAYCSATDTSNVSVMTFTLEHSDSDVAEWWKSFKEDFNNTYEDFEVETEDGEDLKLDGKDAKKWVFSGALTHGDQKDEYKFMQVAAVNTSALSMPEVYVITYTSSPEIFDSHLDQVKLMIDNFKFK